MVFNVGYPGDFWWLTAGPWHFRPGLVAALHGGGYGALVTGVDNYNYHDLKNLIGAYGPQFRPRGVGSFDPLGPWLPLLF